MKKKVLLIGWDAADWKAIHPLMDDGHLPSLNKLVNNGTIGNLATLDPPLSPTLWTSIATGKRPYKHGILGFTEVDPSGSAVRPAHITSRKVRAIWNILSHKGYKCHQIGWWPSHPAEPINGTYISNFYHRASAPISEPWPLLEGSVYPSEKEELYAALRVHPQELTGAHLQPFLPDGDLLDQTDPLVKKRITAIQKIIADCTTVHCAATYTLKNEEWDFMAVYYDAIDHFGHGFMKYHPPRRSHISEKDYKMYKNVVTAGYKYHDMMLGAMLKMVPDDTTIILISDHGFYPDHLRPSMIPQEPAGPAWEHSPYGIIAAAGPNIKKDHRIYGANLLDITPTILALLGLPVGRDMDGKILNQLFINPNKIEIIPSWDEVEGEFYEHPEDFIEDPEATQAALQQLIDLGYIAPPSPNEEVNIKRTLQQNQFFKARSLIDGGKLTEAVQILEQLYDDHPDQLYVAQRLANTYLQLEKTGKARKIVQGMRKNLPELSVPLLILQSRVCMLEGDSDAALKYIQQARSLSYEHPKLFYLEGILFYHIEDYEKAQESLEVALQIDPENHTAYHYLGMVLMKKSEFEAAVEYFLEALGLQFASPMTHFHLAISLVQLGEYHSAENALKNVLHMMPRHKRAKEQLVVLYQDHLERPKLAAAIQASLPDYTLQEVIVVSGLPRSGTSMMMQMLESGGIMPFTDGRRKADENNLKGYYEHERVKNIQFDHSFLNKVGDRAVKIVAPLLYQLPANFRYKIIFMERELGEILLSQHKMLIRSKKRRKTETFSFKLWKQYETLINDIKDKFKNHRNAEFLHVSYSEAISNPLSISKEVAQFLEKDLPLNDMAKVIDPALYRERENEISKND